MSVYCKSAAYSTPGSIPRRFIINLKVYEMNDIAILIDCWDQPVHRYKIYSFLTRTDYRMILNSKKFINNNNKIKTIILSSYQCSDDEVLSNSIWYQNRRRKTRNIFPGKEHLKNGWPTMTTSPMLLNWVIPSKFQIALFFEDEIKNILLNEKIDNIYLFGQSWNKCLKTRPLGYDSLIKIIKENNLNTKLRIKENCVTRFSSKLNPQWMKLENGIYEYDFSILSSVD